MWLTVRRQCWRLCVAFLLLSGAGQVLAIQLGMQVNPDRVRPGEAVVVHLTVTNDSASPVANVSVQARMPAAGVNAISQSVFSGGATCPGTVCDPNELATWTIGLLAPGSGVSVSMVMQATATVADGTVLTIPATVFVAGIAQGSVTQSTTVDGDNALSLSVDADKNGALPGEQLGYALSYANRSVASTTGTTLSLPLPPGVSFVSANAGGSFSGGVITWNLGTVQAGQSGRRQAVVAVDGSLPSGFLLPVDAAQIAGTSAVTGAEIARARVLTRVQSNPVLGLSYAANSDPTRPGETLRATLTVSNRTDAPLFGTVLRARMPTEGINAFSQSLLSSQGLCAGTVCDPYEQAQWTIGTLAPGGSITVSLPLPVAAGFGSGRLIVQEAEVVADGAPMVLARHTVAADADNALSLALDADKDSVAPGERMTYTLTYGNRASSSTTGTLLNLPLPPGVSFVSASGGGNFSGGSVSWNLGTLQAGQSARQQVQVTVDEGQGFGTLLPVNAAQLVGTSAVTGFEQARGSLVTRVESNPVLGLAYAVNADPLRPGEAQRMMLTVTNRSDATVFGTVLRARVPNEGINAVSQAVMTINGTCAGTVCDPTEQAVWNIGTLAPGAAVTVSLPAPVTAGFGSGRLIFSEAEATADGVPMVLARYTASVDPDHFLALAVDTDKDSVAPGDTLTYRLLYGNRSPSSTTSTSLSFPLPEGATLVGASGGTVSGRTVSWNLGTLLSGAGGMRTVTVTVPSKGLTQKRFVVNAATLAGTSAITGVELARASRVTRIIAGNPLRLTLSTARQAVVSGQTLTSTLRVTNTGPVPLIALRVQARIPTEGVSSFNQSALSGGGTCAGTVCDPYELANWLPGTLLPGASISFTAAMPVAANLASGRLLSLEALVRDDGGNLALATASVLVGQYTDTDNDGVPDVLDNCSAIANPDQTDTDGDGYGNACDADFDNNGNVNIADLAAFKASFGSTNALFDLDGNGVVNIADLARFRQLFGQPPGPSGLLP